MVSNKTLIFAKVPEGSFVPSQDVRLEDIPFDLDAVPPAGSYSVQVIYSSFDPYHRRKLIHPEDKQDMEPLELGKPMKSIAILEVLKAGEGCKFKTGDPLITLAPISQYAIIEGQDAAEAEFLYNPLDLDPIFFLGPLGLPGLTAFSGLYEIGKPQKGETILISAASGAVGQVVAALAKQDGLTVIGSVGSDEKLEIIKNQLGFDDGFNYKKGSLSENLKRVAPNGIDIYWDNVGGEQLDAAIEVLKERGRIVACGYSSQYSIPVEQQYRLRNYPMVIGKRLTWRGFNVIDEDFWRKHLEAHQMKLQRWLATDKIKPLLDITSGIENAPDGLAKLFKGENVGKSVLDIWGKKK